MRSFVRGYARSCTRRYTAIRDFGGHKGGALDRGARASDHDWLAASGMSEADAARGRDRIDALE